MKNLIYTAVFLIYSSIAFSQASEDEKGDAYSPIGAWIVDSGPQQMIISNEYGNYRVYWLISSEGGNVTYTQAKARYRNSKFSDLVFPNLLGSGGVRPVADALSAQDRKAYAKGEITFSSSSAAQFIYELADGQSKTVQLSKAADTVEKKTKKKEAKPETKSSKKLGQTSQFGGRRGNEPSSKTTESLSIRKKGKIRSGRSQKGY